ncbi:MAG: aminoacyl-tRNA hydrolase [SAR324 cluster bacterium]|nr:aminoacyl-tRNA hydrolase [SAR324 cluster bacterium]
MIQITPQICIEEHELHEEFIRASGPGGQNVNKVSTAVRLRFDVLNSPSLPHEVRDRLIRLSGKKITAEGILIIEAQRFRTQDRNRADALDRLIKLVRRATERPKPRKPTKPTKQARENRLEEKKLRSASKRMRKHVSNTEL